MSRIAEAFARARAERRKALIAYVCAGDPDLETTRRLVPRLAEAGADIVELGVPFSDPIADGPTIQAASQRALAGGTTVAKVLELVSAIRQDGCQVPLVLMGYLNPIVAMGVAPFCERAARAGADGLIIPDLPLDEAEGLSRAAAERGMDLVLLAAPTTLPQRLDAIGRATRGFLYFVSVAGVTGARAELPQDLPAKLAQARAATTVPVAVGFGISTPDQARALSSHADGIVVGSAIVRTLHASGADATVELVSSLADSLRRES